MKSWYARALVVVFLIALVWAFRVGRGGQTETVPGAVAAWEASSRSEPSQEVAGLRQELAQMKDQLARVLKQQAHRPSLDRPATAVQPESEVGTREAQQQVTGDDTQAMLKLDAQEREVQERQRIEQIVSHLDDSFHREPFDNGWAAPIEASVAKDFGAEDWKGNALTEVRCRSTLCRMVVAHEDLGAADSFVTRMGTLQAFADTEGFYQQVTLEDGTSATVLYIARQGYRLPAMPLP